MRTEEHLRPLVLQCGHNQQLSDIGLTRTHRRDDDHTSLTTRPQLLDFVYSGGLVWARGAQMRDDLQLLTGAPTVEDVIQRVCE